MKGFTGTFRIQGKRFYAVVSILLICFSVTVCEVSRETAPDPLSYNEAVKEVIFTGNIAAVDFNNLYHHDIYLVKINGSGYIVPARNTGGVAQALSIISSEDNTVMPYSPQYSVPRYPRAIQEFHVSPPPFDNEARHAGRLPADLLFFRVGDKKNFWVERYFRENYTTDWENKPATLMASGDHVNIWVADTNTSSGRSKNKITTSQAEELVGRFDMAYPLTTNLLGYEFGGGPGGDGGMDGDKKIQIFIYDIVDEHGEVAAAGYFAPTDFYMQAELDGRGYKSNMAEIFYIDASSLVYYPDYTYSTLIHEFQHMIHFNRKFVKLGLNSSTWFNEMLSEMADDVISPLIGIGHTNIDHPISVEIPTFLNSYYMNGITEWEFLGSGSYAKAYAFGAYLMRNYGGPAFLKRVLDNNKVDIDSLTLALKEFSADMDFGKALTRYGEALIFSGSSLPQDGANGISAVTFDKTAASTINGQVYTAYGFNIWQMRRSGTNDRGPLVLGFETASMRPYSVIIESSSQWKDKTGDFSIMLEKPSNQNVVLFLMAR